VSQLEQELISKKELLELTGISYGQLYRWKRKNLIPEDWFIRKSTYTGQETFFRKQQILDRINKIKDLKDDLSLDELADMFLSSSESSGALSANPQISFQKEELIERNIVSEMTLNFYLQQMGDVTVFPFHTILCVYLLETLLKTGELSLDEGKMLVQTFAEHYKKFEGKNCELIVTRKMGVSSMMLISSPGEIHFDNGVKIVARLDIGGCIKELNLKLK
jgi:DNA-binding transcriptional MerR regulator